MKKLTRRKAEEILKRRGFTKLNNPMLTLREAERMGLSYWNEAIKVAAWVAESYEFTGLKDRELVVVPAVQELIAKAIRKQKVKATSEQR